MGRRVVFGLGRIGDGRIGDGRIGDGRIGDGRIGAIRGRCGVCSYHIFLYWKVVLYKVLAVN